MTKICSKCHEEKPVLGFSKNKSNKGGYSYYCKTCMGGIGKEYRTTHRDYERERCQNYRLSHKDKVSYWAKTGALHNSKHIKEHAKLFRSTHKDQRAAYERLRQCGIKKTSVSPDLFKAIETHVFLCRVIRQKKEAIHA